MKSVMTLAALLALTPALAGAVDLKPEPGWWQSKNQVLVNGQDVLQQMSQLQQQMMAALPAEQRQMMAGMLPKQDLSVATQCVTAKETELLQTPEQWLQRARQDMPNCNFRLTGHTGNSISVAGECRDQEGYHGSMAGTLTMLSSKTMRMDMQGKGKYQLPIAGQQQNGDVNFQLKSESVWQSAQCPAVKEQG